MRKLVNILFFYFPKNVRDLLYFELFSFFGRLFTGRLKLDKNKKNLINLGCGDIIAKDFINIDFFNMRGLDYMADLRYPLKIDDDTVDGIICEHTMEHLTYADDDKLLAECYRIMKKDGVIRIILPDVSLFCEHYVANDRKWFDDWRKVMIEEGTTEERRSKFMSTPMSAISFVTQEYGHVSCWDRETLEFYLSKNKFRDIKICSYKQGRMPELLIDRDDNGRKHVSIFIEAVK